MSGLPERQKSPGCRHLCSGIASSRQRNETKAACPHRDSGAVELTIKSIRTILSELEQAGEIMRFAPAFDADETEKRRLYVTKQIDEFLNGRYESKIDRDYYAKARATLGSYVKGEVIYDDDQFFKHLKPFRADIWEIKIINDPQARLFGAFTSEDCFLAIVPRFRSDCEYGGFAAAMRTVRNQWASWFGSHNRFRCSPLENCICNVGV